LEELQCTHKLQLATLKTSSHNQIAPRLYRRLSGVDSCWARTHVATLRRRLELLEEAFIYDRSIDRETYAGQRQKLQEQLAAADLQLKDALVIDVEPEDVLTFAEGLLSNAAAVWRDATDTHQRAFQLALFPEGVAYDGRTLEPLQPA
jgi:hypothetical protein